MADIPIERKANRNMWPIIIGVLVLLAIIWWAMNRRHDTTAATPTTADTVMTAPATTAPATTAPATTAPAGNAPATTTP
jgi:hypothetical protein